MRHAGSREENGGIRQHCAKRGPTGVGPIVLSQVLVYDIGGGTLDTSLLYMNGNAARGLAA